MLDRQLLRRNLLLAPSQPATALWRAIEVGHLLGSGALPLHGRGLDLGCGDGRITELVRDALGANWQLVGVDPDPGEVELAQASGVYETLQAADAPSLVADDESFDFAFSNSVLEHIDSLDPTLLAVGRVLGPGGVFVFTVPSELFHANLGRPGIVGRLATGARDVSAYRAAIDRRLAHRRYLTLDEWRTALAEVGLEVVESSFYMSRSETRRWALLSNLTAGLLVRILGRGRSPIELQRQLGLRRASPPRWLRAVESGDRRGGYARARPRRRLGDEGLVRPRGGAEGRRPGVSRSVACAGAGWVTRERHLPALKADGRLRLAGVIDKHPDRARDVAQRYGLPHWGTSLDESWLDEIDCLTIGTPPPAHAELIGTAIERGWHCLCEKPFALPAAEGGRLVEAARSAGLVLAVVHNFQFSRSGQRLFELVESGRLGAVQAVYAFQLSNPRRRLPDWYRSLPGGLFLDEAPHLLYLTRRVLGRLEPRSVDARLAGNEIRDLSATFEHESIWASLSMSFTASVSEWQFVVVGDEAVAALDVFRDILVVLPNDRSHRAREILRSSGGMVLGHVAGVVSSGVRLAGKRLLYGNDEVVRRFVDAVEGRPERLRWMSGEDGQAVVASIEEILARAGLDPAAPAT